MSYRYDFLVHATVREEDDWGFPEPDATRVPTDVAALSKLRDSAACAQDLAALKLTNYALAVSEAQVRSSHCTAMPISVQASRDEHCNLACTYCRSSPPESYALMSWSDWESALEVLLPPAIEFLPFCWGEPLIAPGLRETLELAARNRVTVSLITNLQAMTSELAESFVRFVGRALISVDTADPAAFQRIRRGGSLAALERNLDALDDAAARPGLSRPWLGVSAVMMRSTIGGLPRLIRWMSTRGLRGLCAKRIILRSHELQKSQQDELFAFSSREYREVYRECHSLCRSLGIALSMCDPDRPVGIHTSCPAPWQHIYLSPSGHMSVCNFSRLRTVGALPLCEGYYNSEQIVAMRRSWAVGHRCPECQSSDCDGRNEFPGARGY